MPWFSRFSSKFIHKKRLWKENTHTLNASNFFSVSPLSTTRGGSRVVFSRISVPPKRFYSNHSRAKKIVLPINNFLKRNDWLKSCFKKKIEKLENNIVRFSYSVSKLLTNAPIWPKILSHKVLRSKIRAGRLVDKLSTDGGKNKKFFSVRTFLASHRFQIIFYTLRTINPARIRDRF